MTPMMERLCEAAEAEVDYNNSVTGQEDTVVDSMAIRAAVKAVLLAMKEMDRPILEAVGHFNADYSFDNGRDPPFARQLGIAIDAILVTENYLADAEQSQA